MGGIGLGNVQVLAGLVKLGGSVAGGLDTTSHRIECIATGANREKLVGGVVRVGFHGCVGCWR